MSQHILVKKTLVKKDTWQKEVIVDTWQKAVCKWYQKFSDKKLMNQILGKKFMESILDKIRTLEWMQLRDKSESAKHIEESAELLNLT